jgi:hypothetical protein
LDADEVHGAVAARLLNAQGDSRPDSARGLASIVSMAIKA